MDNELSLQEKFREIANKNFALWNEALLTKNPQAVAELYSDEATFLPIVSGEFKKGQSGAEEYFKHFLEKDPIGTILEDQVQALGDNCYLHSGLYNFEIGPASSRTIVEARFSLVWEKDETGEWSIIHHHSSMRPKE